jgi:hypothetical protein
MLSLMWEWTLNWGLVTDDLIVGSCPVETAGINRSLAARND